ncbi:catalytic [Pyrenophora seminiperda CCB06]|uniref:Catalytic n=1 Tax=Pyrenophora seminiperda CCB06 TaxID=1302712 RepID=A0A3M7MCN2_9PLEO|nr:catalytic [Pyrenophora seminiperda CCB06]
MDPYLYPYRYHELIPGIQMKKLISYETESMQKRDFVFLALSFLPNLLISSLNESMRFFRTLLPLALAGCINARECYNFNIPVNIASRQGLFKPVPVEGNIDIAAFVANYLRPGTNYTAELLQDYQTLKGSYNISAQYCKPNGGNSDTIQLLTHGIGFDKTYWDLDFDNYTYSYVNVALKAGYSTLAIDRLGTGLSSQGDPINEIQAQAEVEALNAVTVMLRNGEIPNVGRSYKKVIHVGHSFGSVQTYWLSALYPNNTDGLILTGFSGTTQFIPYVVAGWNLHSARLNQPVRFGNTTTDGNQSAINIAGAHLTPADEWNELATTEVMDLFLGYNETVTSYNYPSGYITSSDLTSLMYAFLCPGYYDIGLALEAERTKQPLTIGEMLTMTNTPHSSSFTGPVLVLTGENDVGFCGGNCSTAVENTSFSNLPAAVKTVFPSASVFESYIQPNTGHGINFHYNASASYWIVQNFLARNGLAAH